MDQVGTYMWKRHIEICVNINNNIDNGIDIITGRTDGGDTGLSTFMENQFQAEADRAAKTMLQPVLQWDNPCEGWRQPLVGPLCAKDKLPLRSPLSDSCS